MVKVIYEPAVALIIKPSVDWVTYSDFLFDNYDIKNMFGLDLDDESKKHARTNPGDLIPMVCAKSCYKAWNTGRKNVRDYNANIIKERHGSVLEHAVYGFVIITTRAITHEIVRHRTFSFAQESQRYCDESSNFFIMPKEIIGDVEAEKKWREHMESSLARYVELVESLEQRVLKDQPQEMPRTEVRKRVRQAARGVLPQDIASIIHMTGNVRSWRHFLEMRASSHADVGIRMVANKIFDSLVRECPVLFSDYQKVFLPDGTFELQTPNRKV